MKMRNVVDANGEHRIAAIEAGRWMSISAGCARLEGREHSENPYGQQCRGGWLNGESVQDAETGEIYPASENISQILDGVIGDLRKIVSDDADVRTALDVAIAGVQTVKEDYLQEIGK